MATPSRQDGSAKSDPEPLSFEAALQRLEDVVRRLEEGQLPLADSLQCYEEGVRMLKHCQQQLAAAEQRVQRLVRLEEDGTPRTETFDDADLTLDEKRSARGRRRSAEPSDDVDAGGRLF